MSGFYVEIHTMHLGALLSYLDDYIYELEQEGREEEASEIRDKKDLAKQIIVVAMKERKK